MLVFTQLNTLKILIFSALRIKFLKFWSIFCCPSLSINDLISIDPKCGTTFTRWTQICRNTYFRPITVCDPKIRKIIIDLVNSRLAGRGINFVTCCPRRLEKDKLQYMGLQMIDYSEAIFHDDSWSWNSRRFLIKRSSYHYQYLDLYAHILTLYYYRRSNCSRLLELKSINVLKKLRLKGSTEKSLDLAWDKITAPKTLQ